jgi:hypothetical protein
MPSDTMKLLDLFSGIGGFSLGFESEGFETIGFAEIDKWANKVLKKHWPEVRNFGDITKAGIEPFSQCGIQVKAAEFRERNPQYSDLSTDQLLSVEDFLVRILATQANAPELPPAVQDYGDTYAEPFAWLDRSTGLWRTWQRCLIMGWTLYLETWPRAGMTRSGIAYRRKPLVLRTSEAELGLFATPTTMDSLAPKSREALEREATEARPGRRKPANLRDQVTNMETWQEIRRQETWPTPTAVQGSLSQNPSRMWPTPTAQDSKNSTLPPSQSSRDSIPGELLRDGESGELNPPFVEWLMGFPIGWTELKDSEMPLCQKSPNLSAEQ